MEGIEKILQNNPRFFAILAIIAGIGLFVYTLNTDSEKLFAGTVNRDGHKDSIFGERFAAIRVKGLFFVISIVLVIAGIVFLISWKE